jgi:hypothetical protein
MRRNKLVFLAIFITCFSAFAEVGNKDLDDIRQLTKTGLYQQALDKHIWFHEASKTSSSMAGVRLSYAIDAWIKLGEKYPPALDALINVRDTNKELLLSGNGDFQYFHDFSSINRELGEEDQTYELFLILDKKYPKQADTYYHVVENLLIEKKEYKLCGKYIGDPIYKYENIRHHRETLLSFEKREPNMNKPRYLKYANKSFIDGVIKLIEVLVAIDKKDEAIEIQKRALSYYDNKKIRNAIN